MTARCELNKENQSLESPAEMGGTPPTIYPTHWQAQ